jgi:hypothetical protein
MVVLLAVFDSLDTISKSQAYQADRTQNLDDMRGVLNRMTKDLRQATSVDESVSTASTITFTTYIDGVSTPIVYTASGTNLTRKVGTNAPFTVLKNLASTDVFTYVAATDVTGVQWVEIELQVHPARSPDTTLVLDSEVNLRNRTAALTGST